ncbi:helix-turn-helix domain-containing protein [Streptomyces sp. NPDC127106]|uniref:helix-turn-helix domain-containing protein n=1 Tax=Streptomyces sp. NPDC127106 TaxID=3345360 RepID=UPI003632E91D
MPCVPCRPWRHYASPHLRLAAKRSPHSPASQPNSQPGPYLTVDEAALILRCSTKWLRDGVNHSGFPHARLSRLLFTCEDVERIFEMHHLPTLPRQPQRASRRKRSQSARKQT